MSCSLCLHQAHPSALTVNLHPFLCSYLALCLALLLPGSSASLLLLLLQVGSLLPCPLSYLVPFCLACFSQVSSFLSGLFSNLFFWSKVGNAEEWGKDEGKGDEEGRGVGCNGVYLCLSLPVNAYLVPHTHVHMNCNIIKYLIKRIFEQ